MKNKLYYFIVCVALLGLISACNSTDPTAVGPLSQADFQATEEGRNDDKYAAALMEATITPTLIPTPVGGVPVYEAETAVLTAWRFNFSQALSLFTDSSDTPLPYEVVDLVEGVEEISADEQNRGLRPTTEAEILEPTPTSTITVPLTDSSGTEDVGEVVQEFVYVTTSGIPNYEVIITDDLLTELRQRPLAGSDFRQDGRPNVNRYTELQFGQDMGYETSGCQATQTGFGYWPPTSECPQHELMTYALPRTPYQQIGDLCPTSLTPLGVWINGVAINTWWDGQFYNIVDGSTTGSAGLWHNIAPMTEGFDLDICNGQVFEGVYSHNSYPICLAQELGDNGAQHSPILGFAVDGYPIYGPWESNGDLAKSCWKRRNYDNADSVTSCGIAGQRTCLLNDPYDVSQGNRTVARLGPQTSTLLTTESGNAITAESGVFYEDYYYDTSCAQTEAEQASLVNSEGDLILTELEKTLLTELEQTVLIELKQTLLDELKQTLLDEHNGHHDETRGYHYHVTVLISEDNIITPVFPFTAGPAFAGAIYDNSDQICYLPDENTTFFQIEYDANIDLSAIALELGVSEVDLRNALINSGGNLAVAAASLGIGERALSAALTGGGYVVDALRSIDLQAAASRAKVSAAGLKQAAQDIQQAGQTLAEAAAILGITPENLGKALKAGGYAFNALRQVDIILVAEGIKAGAEELAAGIAAIQSGVSDMATVAAELGMTPAELTAALAAYDIDIDNLDFDTTAVQAALSDTLSSVDLAAAASTATDALSNVDLTAAAAVLGTSAEALGSSLVVGADGAIDYAQSADVLGVSEEVLQAAMEGVDLSAIDVTTIDLSIPVPDLSEIDPGVSLQNPIVIDE